MVCRPRLPSRATPLNNSLHSTFRLTRFYRVARVAEEPHLGGQQAKRVVGADVEGWKDGQDGGNYRDRQ
jgi:hypothetical protein